MAFQNEADVKERRQKLGEEADAPLREKTVAKLLRVLNEEQVGQKICRAWDNNTSYINEQLTRQQAYLDNIDSFQQCEGASNAFGGTSNIHLPVAFTIVKSYHARFFDALFNVDPPFSVKPRREDSTDSVQVVEDLIKFAILTMANRGKGIKPAADTWIWNWVVSGMGIMKTRWLTEWERYIKIDKRSVQKEPLTQLAPDGTTIQLPQWDVVEEEKDVTERVQYCPQYDVINLEDFRMIGGEGDPDTADMVIHRTYMEMSTLWTGVDRGIYEEDVVRAIADRPGDDPLMPGDQTGNIKQQRKLKAGDHTFTTEDERSRCEVIECCLKYDVDGSGITTEIVVLVEKRTEKILSANYLRRMSSSGRRPYAVAYFHRRPGENFGLGLVEILEPYTNEIDMMHNIRIDNALFQSTPFYLYKKKPGQDHRDLVIEPGMGIPVDEHDDIYFPQLPNRTGFTAQEEAALQQYIERLTGISDLSLGVMSGTQGATRTASGVRALMGENNSNLSIHLTRLNLAWDRVLTNTWALLRDYIEPGFTFRIIGDDGKDVFRKVDDYHFGIDVDFDISSNSGNSNKAVQVEIAQTLYQLTSNMLDVQMGIVTPDNRYAAIKNYLVALGVKDVHRYIQRPVGYQYTLSPQEEFMRVIRGEQYPVAPNQDHNGFVAFAQHMMDVAAQGDPSSGVSLTGEQKDALVQQMKAHTEMQAAMEQQAAQTANTQQMMMNSQMGAPAPVTYSNQQNNYGQLF